MLVDRLRRDRGEVAVLALGENGQRVLARHVANVAIEQIARGDVQRSLDGLLVERVLVVVLAVHEQALVERVHAAARLMAERLRLALERADAQRVRALRRGRVLVENRTELHRRHAGECGRVGRRRLLDDHHAVEEVGRRVHLVLLMLLLGCLRVLRVAAVARQVRTRQRERVVSAARHIRRCRCYCCRRVSVASGRFAEVSVELETLERGALAAQVVVVAQVCCCCCISSRPI